MNNYTAIGLKSRPLFLPLVDPREITRVVEVPGRPRKVHSNPRSFTGVIALQGGPGTVEFESNLERDLIETLDMAPGVHSISAQKMCLEFDYQGKPHTYHPDIEADCELGKVDGLPFTKESVVIEVKPESELFEKQKDLAPKFTAAFIFCEQRGRQFLVLTEKHIRTLHLENVKRLRKYLSRAVIPEIYQVLNKLILENGPLSIEQLLYRLESYKWKQSDIVDTLFSLIANRVFQFPTNTLLTKSSLLWCGEKSCGSSFESSSEKSGTGSND
ncbi:MAG: TnsA endonuclease N-terminal domain-containing protein [Betaproteobacteria bacterium]|jgi:TnsA endonuclease C terminal